MNFDDLVCALEISGNHHLEALVSPEIESLETQVQAVMVGNPTAIEVRVAVCIGVLTKDFAPIGGAVAWAHLVTAHHEAIVNQLAIEFAANAAPAFNHAVDCCVAYGLGWRRTVLNGHPTTPEHRWPRAAAWLRFQFIEAVNIANRFLENSVNCLMTAGGWDYLEDADTVHKIADKLLAWYLDPEHSLSYSNGQVTVSYRGEAADIAVNGVRALTMLPGSNLTLQPQGDMVIAPFQNDASRLFRDGNRAVIRCGDLQVRIKELKGPANLGPESPVPPGRSARLEGDFDVLECQCGGWYCKDRHRLEKWRPADISLSRSVINAVRGQLPNPHANSFAEGMYGAYLGAGLLRRSDRRTRWGQIRVGKFEAEPEERPSPSGEYRRYRGTMECLFYLGDPPSYESIRVRRCRNRYTPLIKIFVPDPETGALVQAQPEPIRCGYLLEDQDRVCPFCDAPTMDNWPPATIYRPNENFPHARIVGYDYYGLKPGEVPSLKDIQVRRQRKGGRRNDG